MIKRIKELRWPLSVVAILLTTVSANLVLLWNALDDPSGGYEFVDDYARDGATDRKSRTLGQLNADVKAQLPVRTSSALETPSAPE